MAYDIGAGDVTIGAACTNYPTATVSITVPGPGVVVLSASVRVLLSHNVGTRDQVYVSVSGVPGSCPFSPGLSGHTIPASWPTDGVVEVMASPTALFSVLSAGTYTFYVDSVMWSGADVNDRILEAWFMVVYYAT